VKPLWQKKNKELTQILSAWLSLTTEALAKVVAKAEEIRSTDSYRDTELQREKKSSFWRGRKPIKIYL
jgi:hypothetical protein